jgi:hypothetical protein
MADDSADLSPRTPSRPACFSSTRSRANGSEYGSNDMTEVGGEGSAELKDDGTIEIEIAYHNGDDATLKAVPTPPSST